MPLHTHGAVLAETIYGRKRWMLYPPDARPKFDGDESSYLWALRAVPDFGLCATNPWIHVIHEQHLDRTCSQDRHEMLMCTLHPHEVLFIPALWYHATLNLDETVFISLFL